MGEYFNWVNVDKREYICPADFDQGNKSHETIQRTNPLLRALRELLSGEWKGDRVLFLGDECSIPAHSELGIMRELYRQTVRYGYPGDAFDMMCETYRNVSCLFKAAEPDVRREIGFYIDSLNDDTGYQMNNEYGIDPADPYKGLFQKPGMDSRFIVDHTKKVAYSFERTKILYLDHSECGYADPLPILMRYGRSVDTGLWLGDMIGVADELSQWYTILDKIYLDW